jgi:ABC-type transport system involved in cytochrome c biogenesis permease subunit
LEFKLTFKLDKLEAKAIAIVVFLLTIGIIAGVVWRVFSEISGMIA